MIILKHINTFEVLKIGNILESFLDDEATVLVKPSVEVSILSITFELSPGALKLAEVKMLFKDKRVLHPNLNQFLYCHYFTRLLKGLSTIWNK